MKLTYSSVYMLVENYSEMLGNLPITSSLVHKEWETERVRKKRSP